MDLVKVLIVDDSKVIRDILYELLNGCPQVEVVGMAENPFEARDKIKILNPDVMTLDIEMPKMDGITFLRNLMRLRPMPVVMLSTLTQKGADITLEALEIGAIDFIEKPNPNAIIASIETFKNELIEKVTNAAKANCDSIRENKTTKEILRAKGINQIRFKNNYIIAVGASTGGTDAITKLLTVMPVNCPPIIITQHIPKSFSERFANRLNKTCNIKVKEAKSGAQLLPGVAYIAPGDQHLRIEMKNCKYICILDDSAKVNRHRPSVDVMYNSLTNVNCHIQAILLTGMGNDGAQGMKALKENGAMTIIQSKRTSLIWGMPGSAARIEAHQHELDLEDIAEFALLDARDTCTVINE